LTLLEFIYASLQMFKFKHLQFESILLPGTGNHGLFRNVTLKSVFWIWCSDECVYMCVPWVPLLQRFQKGVCHFWSFKI